MSRYACYGYKKLNGGYCTELVYVHSRIKKNVFSGTPEQLSNLILKLALAEREFR